MQTAGNTAFLTDGELADTAFLQSAAPLAVAEVAFCGGDVGGVPSVMGDVEDGQRGLLELDRSVGLLRLGTGGGYYVVFVWGVGEIGGRVKICVCRWVLVLVVGGIVPVVFGG